MLLDNLKKNKLICKQEKNKKNIHGFQHANVKANKVKEYLQRPAICWGRNICHPTNGLLQRRIDNDGHCRPESRNNAVGRGRRCRLLRG